MSDLASNLSFYIQTMGAVSRVEIDAAFGPKSAIDSIDYALKQLIAKSGRICRITRMGVTYYQYFPLKDEAEETTVAVTKDVREKIATLVLDGADLVETASKYECLLLTATRQVQNFCKDRNPEHYKVLVEVAQIQRRKTPSIAMLIKHKKHFLGA